MRVQVLVSTYNGAAHLRPLVESLLAQDYPHLDVLVRDDGSSDGTIHLLREYAGVHPNVEVIAGENLGVTRSFFKLLELSSPAAGYLALCDQDDVWRPDKLSRAVTVLNDSCREGPALYCSRLAVVDEHLNLLGYSDIPRRGLSFRNALVQSAFFGCTSVFNQAARELLLREFPRHACAHDWWMYLVASAFGVVIYDEEPRILYRKHPANVSGITLRAWDTWRVKLGRFLKYGRLRLVTGQAEEFRRIYGPLLPGDHRRTLERFLERRPSVWDRLGYALSGDVYRQSRRDDLILKALIVLDRLVC